MRTILDRLRRSVLARDGAGLTDGQLLESFVGARDEAAFAALVRLHGAMVFGVCRRVLGNHHDAEDAFQATFLVLARKAASVSPRDRVANWLYGVAHRTALKAKCAIARRQVKERQLIDVPDPNLSRPQLPSELQPLLDQELSRLHEKYRLPIIFCDLEGKTHKEAARQLGWPEGTLSVRLMRARTMLAERLTRRGFALTSAGLATVFVESVAASSVSAATVAATIKAACLFAAGQTVHGLVSTPVAILTQGVLQSMLLTKIKLGVVVLLVLSAMGTGAALFPYPAAADEKPIAKSSEKKDGAGKVKEKAADKDANEEEAKLVNELVEAAKGECEARWHEFGAGRGTLSLLQVAARQLLKAQLEKAEKKDERIAARQAHYERMSEIEKLCKARFDAGRLSEADYQSSRFWRVEAKLELEREKRQGQRRKASGSE